MVFKYANTVSRKLWNSLTVIFIIMLLSSSSAFAQRTREEPPPLRERLFFGGSFGLQLGSITDIEVAPVAGIWVLPRVAVAVGPNYRFYKDPIGRTDIYGGRIYSEFVVIQDLNSIIPLNLNFGFFLHAEDELLSLESEFWKDPPYPADRFYINTGLAGVGMRQPVGIRSSMNLMVLWPLNSPAYSVYGNPEFRISFIF